MWFRKEKTELNYVVFEATSECNLHCIYCYNHWKRPGEAPLQVPEKQYNQNIATLRKLFKVAHVKHVTFSGGEPSLSERLEEQILFCRMKGASISLISNGYALTTERISELIRLGVSLFEFPFHSHIPSVHDRMTGVVGSWEKARHNMLVASKMGAMVVPVVVITQHNAGHLGETLTELHRLGFNRMMLNRYNIGGRNVQASERVSANKAELNEAFAQASKVGAQLKLSLSSNVCTPHCIVDPLHFRNIAFTNCSPNLAQRPLTLTADGNLRFCNHSPSVLGNIFTHELSKLLETNYFNVDAVPEFCADCSKYSRCLGGCRAAAEQVGRSFNDVDPLALQGLRPAASGTA